MSNATLTPAAVKYQADLRHTQENPHIPLGKRNYLDLRRAALNNDLPLFETVLNRATTLAHHRLYAHALSAAQSIFYQRRDARFLDAALDGKHTQIISVLDESEKREFQEIVAPRQMLGQIALMENNPQNLRRLARFLTAIEHSTESAVRDVYEHPEHYEDPLKTATLLVRLFKKQRQTVSNRAPSPETNNSAKRAHQATLNEFFVRQNVATLGNPLSR